MATEVEMASAASGPGGSWFRPASASTGGLVHLVEGPAFCVSGRSGDIHPGASQGLFFLDTRLLSQLELTVDGRPIEPLTVVAETPFSATHVGRPIPAAGAGDAPGVVVRRRHVGAGMREDVELRNHSAGRRSCEVRLVADCDFADLFDVKEGLAEPGRRREVEVAGGEIRFRLADPPREVSIRFTPPPDVIHAGGAAWSVTVEAQGSWRLCLEVALRLDGRLIPPSHPCGIPVEEAAPATRLHSWRRAAPRITSDVPGLAASVREASEDLAALRIFDPDHPGRPVIAAGAPWFMTLFGRDSLLTAWMALMVDPDLARGVLETLADFQGSESDPDTEEQPGKILHEVRFGRARSLGIGGGSVYYGSIDATPLFVMLLGEVRRWGLDPGVVRRLKPHAARAIRWMEEYGDLDGDGYLEYLRTNPRGLLHQGWKDSWDGVRFADGSLAEPPIALSEVQGYAYAAYLAMADLVEEDGDEGEAERLRRRAAELRDAFNRDFWLADRGWYAMGLDGDGRPIDALVSNMGHCLWTGIVAEERAARVAELLASEDMFSGWGVRTTASSMAGYNPMSYHSGSVWPHDTAIAAAGLRRYGFFEEAHRLVSGLLELAESVGGRLPELISGLSRTEFPVPVPYPTSCSPQAWSAAAPLLVLRTLLGFDPDVPHRLLVADPSLPSPAERLHVDGVPLGGGRVSVDFEGGRLSVEGVPHGVDVVHRHPAT